MSIKIIKTESTYDLYCHYSGQTERQSCYIELDCENKTLSARYNSEIGNAIPFSVYYGHDQIFGIDLLRGETANALMEEILPLAERVVGGYDSHWDGNNWIAKFSDDAADAIDLIQRRCEEEDGDIEVWDAGDWIDGITYCSDTSVEIEDIGTITSKTTDEEIDEMVTKIDNFAEGEGVLLNGTESVLKSHRENLEQEDD